MQEKSPINPIGDIDEGNTTDDIDSKGYAVLISMVILYIIFQNEILYTDYKRGILSKNRYMPLDPTINFFDKVRENLKISTSHLRKGRTLYRARITDGRSALMLVCARARYVTNSHWGTKCYMPMKYLNDVTPDKVANIA